AGGVVLVVRADGRELAGGGRGGPRVGTGRGERNGRLRGCVGGDWRGGGLAGQGHRRLAAACLDRRSMLGRERGLARTVVLGCGVADRPERLVGTGVQDIEFVVVDLFGRVDRRSATLVEGDGVRRLVEGVGVGVDVLDLVV